jgi:hypothetical protein
VPGHEIVGRVSAVGAHVADYKVGDLVGVGCIVDSCKHCADCESGLENYCDGMIGTYNFPTPDAPGHTLGGYSQKIVVHERYVLRIRHPEAQLAAVAPLLCAGITTYSPLRHWNAGPGKKGRRRRHRRPRPHGHQAGSRSGCPRGRVHHLGIEAQGCQGAGRRRGCGVAQPRRWPRTRRAST